LKVTLPHESDGAEVGEQRRYGLKLKYPDPLIVVVVLIRDVCSAPA
jgi:hypothetical protein